jgi:integrase
MAVDSDGLQRVDNVAVIRSPQVSQHRAPLVFPTSAGKRDNPSNIRNPFLDSAARLANADLRAAGREPMPDVTPHSLRRTFISLLLAAGADVPYVMAQAGHTDPKMTLGLYAQVIASKTDHGAALDGIVDGAFSASALEKGEGHCCSP